MRLDTRTAWARLARRRLFFGLALLALDSLGGCTSTPVKTHGKDSEEVHVKSNGTMRIHLSATEGPRLKALLVNQTEAVQVLLHDVSSQPSQLELTDTAGQRVVPFDSRSNTKEDGTLYCSAFRELKPGGELELFTSEFRPVDGGFTAHWGPFEFEQLPPGEYTARVVWKSEAESCFDEESGQMRPLPARWLGTLQSNPVKLVLR